MTTLGFIIFQSIYFWVSNKLIPVHQSFDNYPTPQPSLGPQFKEFLKDCVPKELNLEILPNL